jgi:K+-sensing histidine kinase KdpD
MTGGRDRPAEDRAQRAEQQLALERRRRRILQGLAGALIRSRSVPQAAQVVAERGHAAMGARGTLLAALGTDGPRTLAVGRDPATDAFAGIAPGDPPPPWLRAAIEGGRAVFGMTHPERPDVVLAVLPLHERRRHTGAVVWELRDTAALDADARSFMRTVAMHAGLGLERARATERTRAALAQVDSGRRRLDVLVNAGRVLGSTLDPDETLIGLARSAIPMMGDYCVVDSIEPGGGYRRHVASAGAGHPDIAAALQSRSLSADSFNDVLEAMRSGRISIIAIDEPLIDRSARDPGHLEVLRAMGGRYALIVPLTYRGRTLGCLSFVTVDPARRYDATDVALGAVLAQRASKALENSHLHAEVQQLAAQERERAAELRSVLAAIGEGIVRIDAEGRVTAVNEAALRMLGVTVATESELWARLAGSGPIPSASLGFEPTEYPLGNPARRWVEVAGYPLSHGAPDGSTTTSGGVLVLRDVTAFRQGQGLREAFLGLLSHELRTPVTSIYAGAMVLGSRGDRLDAETRAGILGDIVAEADRLFRLTEDLLVLARFDEGLELVGEPSLLQRLVPSVVSSEQRHWPQARFRVTTQNGLPAVTGDDTSIQQIVRNLLSNAAKYAVTGVVDVRVESEGDGVRVRVLDRGPGFGGLAPADLFTPFYRAPAAAAVAGGAGIGLHVCQRLIEAMGGRIWARARPGGGSEFGFWLPAYETEVDEQASKREFATLLQG